MKDTEEPNWSEAKRLYCETAQPVSSIARDLNIGRGALRGLASREGWERPEPKVRPIAPTGGTYADAESYLAAVVSGIEPPDPLRVAAARALLPYQKRAERRPLPPKRTAAEQVRQDALAETSSANSEWAEIVKQTQAEITKRT